MRRRMLTLALHLSAGLASAQTFGPITDIDDTYKDDAQADAHRRFAVENDPVLAGYDTEHDRLRLQGASPMTPNADPSLE